MNFQRIVIAGAAIALLAAPLVAQSAASSSQDAKTYQFVAQNGSGETGSVSLAAAGKTSTTVTIALAGAPSGAQPAHIHKGSCTKLGAVTYPLSSVVDGKSTTTVKAPMAELLAGGLAVNVHKSTNDMGTYVACADLATAKAAAPSTAATPM